MQERLRSFCDFIQACLPKELDDMTARYEMTKVDLRGKTNAK
jgi:hypothetical protein